MSLVADLLTPGLFPTSEGKRPLFRKGSDYIHTEPTRFQQRGATTLTQIFLVKLRRARREGGKGKKKGERKGGKKGGRM